ncbi:hypothetical protein HUG17_1983 [Dermatophagoides farinae]|uniref:MARVEL domain-containing protein n=1 Tax=Dermatophagoides farinae TaxID=6954 RepID=A0A9D4PAU2_DERFA|nr:hypothetical protein HUG17_1983 [Dermatophagoides farinae]
MAISKTCMTMLITVFNILIIILAIIICFLSLNAWNDYTTCAFTILVALLWMCCLCSESNVAIGAYTILMFIDLLLLLSNALYHSVMTAKYSDFCFHNNVNGISPEWGCHDWRFSGYYERAIGVTVCYYIAFIFRLLNIVGSCSLTYKIFHEKKKKKKK